MILSQLQQHDRNLSLSGSLFLSFFFSHQRKTSHARGHFGLLGPGSHNYILSANLALRIYDPIATSACPALGIHYSFGASHFLVPGFHNTFSAHLGPFNSIGQNLHYKIYTQKCNFFTPHFCSLKKIPRFACKNFARVKLHANDPSSRNKNALSSISRLILFALPALPSDLRMLFNLVGLLTTGDESNPKTATLLLADSTVTKGTLPKCGLVFVERERTSHIDKLHETSMRCIQADKFSSSVFPRSQTSPATGRTQLIIP